MDDLESSILDAWQRLKPDLLAEPRRLVARLARRSSATFNRPPRAWCLAVRANDLRLTPALARCEPEAAASDRYAFGDHNVTLNAFVLKKLCKPVKIDPPGEPVADVARKLGVLPITLTTARLKGEFRTHWIPRAGGRGGRDQQPMLHIDRQLDPNARLYALPDPMWLWTASYLTAKVPDDFEQTVKRQAMYHPWCGRTRYAEHVHPELDLPTGKRRRSHLPPPPPDPVWYKWKDGLYLGYDWRVPGAKQRYERRQQKLQRRRDWDKQRRLEHPPPGKSRGSMRFNGWRWLCPRCGRTCKVLLLPLPPVNLLARVGGDFAVPPPHRPPPKKLHFGCGKCLRVAAGSSRAHPDMWNILIAQLTGGLLYGREVPKPSWWTTTRKRAYAPQKFRPAPRREQVLSLFRQGLRVCDIARRMRLSDEAVCSHIASLCRQHGVPNRLALAARLGIDLIPRPSPTQDRIRPLFLAGLSPSQIADALGMKLSSVYRPLYAVQRQHRANLVTLQSHTHD